MLMINNNDRMFLQHKRVLKTKNKNISHVRSVRAISALSLQTEDTYSSGVSQKVSESDPANACCQHYPQG